MRDRILRGPPGVARALRGGVFTEFMEQRPPGIRLDGQDLPPRPSSTSKADIAAPGRPGLPPRSPRPGTGASSCWPWDIACDAVILFARRHAELASARPRGARPRPRRGAAPDRGGLPARARPRPPGLPGGAAVLLVLPLAVITELNGWDAFNPATSTSTCSRFYERGLAEGSLAREAAKELLSASS